MALDPRYIALFTLQQDFLDKITGLQLQGGAVYTWQDNNRNNPKPLYQLSGAPPNYSFTPLPNPIILTNAGTASDGSGNDIVWYAFPYDNAGQPDNYYIQIFAQPTLPPFPPVGTPILTREAVPGITDAATINLTGQSGPENELVNSQFANVIFDPDYGMTIPFINGTTDTAIAPGWRIRLNGNAAGTITVNRDNIAGTSKVITQPPYSLTINPAGAVGLTNIVVYQRLEGNPNIFAGATSNPPTSAFISAGIALDPGSQATVYYAPEGNIFGPALVTAVNGTGLWNYTSLVTQIQPGANANSGPTSFVEIQIVIPTTQVTTFSSVQIVGMDQNIPGIPYNQQTAINQINQTFYYYKPQLDYKPIPSYLVGWDFPMNPAQINGETVAANAPVSVGAAKSRYVWDQTIVFQTTNDSIAVSRDTASQGITFTVNPGGSFAVVQYIEVSQARELLQGNMSVFISGLTNNMAGYFGSVTLWATDDAMLPDLKTPNFNSLVTAVDAATGIPTCANGTWTKIPRDSLGDVRFLFAPPTSELAFNGWTLTDTALTGIRTTTKYMAIVIGFETVTAADTITLHSVGLCAGDIATRPSPKCADETLRDCERYYEKSYASNVLPGTVTTVNALVAPQDSSQAGAAPAGNTYVLEASFGYQYRTLKRVVNPTVAIYSPATGTANRARFFAIGNAVNPFEETVSTIWGTTYVGDKHTSYVVTTNSGQNFAAPANTDLQCYLTYHYTVDARLGIVL